MDYPGSHDEYYTRFNPAAVVFWVAVVICVILAIAGLWAK